MDGDLAGTKKTCAKWQTTKAKSASGSHEAARCALYVRGAGLPTPHGGYGSQLVKGVRKKGAGIKRQVFAVARAAGAHTVTAAAIQAAITHQKVGVKRIATGKKRRAERKVASAAYRAKPKSFPIKKGKVRKAAAVAAKRVGGGARRYIWKTTRAGRKICWDKTGQVQAVTGKCKGGGVAGLFGLAGRRRKRRRSRGGLRGLSNFSFFGASPALGGLPAYFGGGSPIGEVSPTVAIFGSSDMGDESMLMDDTLDGRRRRRRAGSKKRRRGGVSGLGATSPRARAARARFKACTQAAPRGRGYRASVTACLRRGKRGLHGLFGFDGDLADQEFLADASPKTGSLPKNCNRFESVFSEALGRKIKVCADLGDFEPAGEMGEVFDGDGLHDMSLAGPLAKFHGFGQVGGGLGPTAGVLVGAAAAVLGARIVSYVPVLKEWKDGWGALALVAAAAGGVAYFLPAQRQAAIGAAVGVGAIGLYKALSTGLGGGGVTGYLGAIVSDSDVNGYYGGMNGFGAIVSDSDVNGYGMGDGGLDVLSGMGDNGVDVLSGMGDGGVDVLSGAFGSLPFAGAV